MGDEIQNTKGAQPEHNANECWCGIDHRREAAINNKQRDLLSDPTVDDRDLTIRFGVERKRKPTPSPEQPEHEEARRLAELRQSVRFDVVPKRPARWNDVAFLLALLSKAEQERDDLRELLGRVLDAGVEQWHETRSPNGTVLLHIWLGLTTEEYAAFVEQRPPFAALTSSSEASDG